MTEPFIGQVMMVSFDFAPENWALCNGQLLSVSEYPALFSLLGTRFGGDGTDTFGLPDLRGRGPVHQGQGAGLSARTMGESGSAESVALAEAEMPVHTHAAVGFEGPGAGAQTNPGGNTWGIANNDPVYNRATPNTPMNPEAIDQTGGGEAHENMPPFQVVNFIISLRGSYPLSVSD